MREQINFVSVFSATKHIVQPHYGEGWEAKQMAIKRCQFDKLRERLGAHTSWAVWAPAGDKPKSNVGDLSIFKEEQKISEILPKLNPDIVLAGLNGSNSGRAIKKKGEDFANFHSDWYRATDYKIRYATERTALEGAFMTDVIKHHYETDSNIVARNLRKNPEYERDRVKEFFDEITSISESPTIFAFGGMAYGLIQKYNNGRFRVFQLYHYAFTMSKERFREETLNSIGRAGLL